ncbi:hypothetical protein ACFWPQ_28365 [Streptomyces sp. NPDC058464]|uniref:hypothetical protein n=1 Tax=Streptomyces sp. NPDC058464 TaxID=3346511 RepID=UPI003659F018
MLPTSSFVAVYTAVAIAGPAGIAGNSAAILALRARRLELALFRVKRDTLTDLRDAGRIDDIVLRTVSRRSTWRRSGCGRGKSGPLAPGSDPRSGLGGGERP